MDGRRGKELPFVREAIVEVYRLTGGIARDICKLANESLLHAVVQSHKLVDKDTVALAAADAFEQV